MLKLHRTHCQEIEESDQDNQMDTADQLLPHGCIAMVLICWYLAHTHEGNELYISNGNL